MVRRIDYVTIHDPLNCKLGKKTAIHPKGMRMMAELTTKLPTPPPAVGWYRGYPLGTNAVDNFPMDANDTLGDCTIAGVSHLLQLWTTVTGTPVVPTDAEVINEYSLLCGYVPGESSTDQGGIESDILKAWQTTGIFGHKITGYVGINPASQTQLKDSIWFFGGAYLGIGLPISAQNQTVWDVPAGGANGEGTPGSWGGHCVPAVAADDRYVVVVTWGGIKLMTWEFMQTYCDEAYAILSPDWVKGTATVGGVPLASLEQDLKSLSGV